MLDEIYNPGLREAIKTYSAWPTIPQVGGWVGGWVGGFCGDAVRGLGKRWGGLLLCDAAAAPFISPTQSLPCPWRQHHPSSALSGALPAALQVYVGGEFVGGADIVEAMNTSGEPCPACQFDGWHALDASLHVLM